MIVACPDCHAEFDAFEIGEVHGPVYRGECSHCLVDFEIPADEL